MGPPPPLMLDEVLKPPVNYTGVFREVGGMCLHSFTLELNLSNSRTHA